MDPLTITTGVVSLLKLCGTVGFSLKELHDGAQLAGPKADALVSEVQAFTRVLELMRSTLEDEKVQTAFQSTGHIGNHWRSISACLDDGQHTLRRLKAKVGKASKNVTVLDATRKHFRLKFAADEIAVFQQSIRTCRDTMQLSIQTVILWNQVSFQESADKIVPGLDALTSYIRVLATDMNNQMAALGKLVESNRTRDRIQSLERMKACVQTASEVVSSASTTLGMDDRASVAAASDFGDIFPPEPSETVRRWMSDNTVPELEEYTLDQSPPPSPSSSQENVVQASAAGSDDGDSDAELEVEVVVALWKHALSEYQQGNTQEAVKHMRAAMSRARRSEKYFARDLKLKISFLSEVLWLYRKVGDWEGAKACALGRLSAISQCTAEYEDSLDFMQATLDLIEVLIELKETTQARLYAKKCIKAYRRLGSRGRSGLERSLRLLIEACRMDNDEEGAHAYQLILSDLTSSESVPSGQYASEQHRDVPSTRSSTQTNARSSSSAAPSSDQDVGLIESHGVLRSAPLTQEAAGLPFLHSRTPSPSPRTQSQFENLGLPQSASNPMSQPRGRTSSAAASAYRDTSVVSRLPAASASSATLGSTASPSAALTRHPKRTGDIVTFPLDVTKRAFSEYVDADGRRYGLVADEENGVYELGRLRLASLCEQWARADRETIRTREYTHIDQLFTLLTTHQSLAKLECGNETYKRPGPDKTTIGTMLDPVLAHLGCANPGYAPNGQFLTIHIGMEEQTYKVLASSNLIPDRATKSIILMCPDGRIRCYTRGHTRLILSRLLDNGTSRDTTWASLVNKKAHQGFSTMCLAWREISEAEFQSWQTEETSTNDGGYYGRPQGRGGVWDRIESDLHLLGAIIIDEAGLETSREDLTGCVIWGMTQYNLGTARWLAAAHRMVDEEMHLVSVDPGLAVTEELIEHLLDTGSSFKTVALAVDGLDLIAILGSSQLRRRFRKLLRRCAAVIFHDLSDAQMDKVTGLAEEMSKPPSVLDRVKRSLAGRS